MKDRFSLNLFLFRLRLRKYCNLFFKSASQLIEMSKVWYGLGIIQSLRLTTFYIVTLLIFQLQGHI